jgi:hypothetical protein
LSADFVSKFKVWPQLMSDQHAESKRKGKGRAQDWQWLILSALYERNSFPSEEEYDAVALETGL